MIRLSDTRERIMERAAHLLMSRGFNGFSYSDISSHLGVKNAAVHYHFPSKADLAKALVEEYRRVLMKGTSEFMAYGGSALKQLEGFLNFTARQYQQGNCVCAFGAFAVDFSELPPEVQDATADLMREVIKWLTRVLEVGREQDEFSFEGDARSKALLILAGLQGARQMARFCGYEALENIIAKIHQELGLLS